jgi:hypothetical protein
LAQFGLSPIGDENQEGDTDNGIPKDAISLGSLSKAEFMKKLGHTPNSNSQNVLLKPKEETGFKSMPVKSLGRYSR